jgi:hypothetical protein
MAMRRLVLSFACLLCAWFATSAEVRAEEPEALPSPDQAASDDLLRLALGNEIRGEVEQRDERLQEALDILPEEKLTNWLLGKLLVDGKWQSVTQLQKANADDPRLAEYRRRRELLDGKHHTELELARWCKEHSWDDLARLHYLRLLAYPDATEAVRSEVRRVLDLHAVGGTYYTSAELASVEQQNKDKQEAFERWRPKLLAWHKALSSKNRAHREKNLAELRGVDDPRAILAIEASLYDANDAFAGELIALLGKFPEFESTRALVRFALLTSATPLAQSAVTQLKPRPIHDYYPQVLLLMQAPL